LKEGTWSGYTIAEAKKILGAPHPIKFINNRKGAKGEEK